MSRPWFLLALTAVTSACAADDETQSGARARNRATVERTHREALQRYGGNPDKLVLPGLAADRKQKTVRFLAETTGLAEDQTCEFFIVAENSGRDYESLAVAFAKPSDIHKALVFIGMPPGIGTDMGKLRFWPKGERVWTRLIPFDGGANATPFSIEDAIRDNRTGKTLPRTGLAFIGSRTGEGEITNAAAYSADVMDPNAVASTYNEPRAVLDVPRKAVQGEVYTRLVVDAKGVFPTNGLVWVELEPEHKDGAKRCLDLSLTVTRTATNAGAAAQVLFDLKDEHGSALCTRSGFDAVVRAVGALVAKGRDTFVTLHLDDALPLGKVRDVCGALAALESENGFRIDAPPASNLYYKAFLPPEEHRDRAGRMAQPWELKLSRGSATVTGALVRIEEQWKEGAPKVDLIVTEYPVPTPHALRKQIDTLGPGLPVILVFTAPDVTHGELMAFLGPVQSTHPTIHVYLDAPVASAAELGRKP
jgi:hypothetical protein